MVTRGSWSLTDPSCHLRFLQDSHNMPRPRWPQPLNSGRMAMPSKCEALTQCCFNVGPSSKTVGYY